MVRSRGEETTTRKSRSVSCKLHVPLFRCATDEDVAAGLTTLLLLLRPLLMVLLTADEEEDAEEDPQDREDPEEEADEQPLSGEEWAALEEGELLLVLWLLAGPN